MHARHMQATGSGVGMSRSLPRSSGELQRVKTWLVFSTFTIHKTCKNSKDIMVEISWRKSANCGRTAKRVDGEACVVLE